jgi:hypothetical protein
MFKRMLEFPDIPRPIISHKDSHDLIRDPKDFLFELTAEMAAEIIHK